MDEPPLGFARVFPGVVGLGSGGSVVPAQNLPFRFRFRFLVRLGFRVLLAGFLLLC